MYKDDRKIRKAQETCKDEKSRRKSSFERIKSSCQSLTTAINFFHGES